MCEDGGCGRWEVWQEGGCGRWGFECVALRITMGTWEPCGEMKEVGRQCSVLELCSWFLLIPKPSCYLKCEHKH